MQLEEEAGKTVFQRIPVMIENPPASHFGGIRVHGDVQRFCCFRLGTGFKKIKAKHIIAVFLWRIQPGRIPAFGRGGKLKLVIPNKKLNYC